MCCCPNREAARAATHYHTRAWQTLLYGKNVLSSYWSIILFTEWRAVLTPTQYVMNGLIHIVTFASRMIVLMLKRRVSVMTVFNLCVQNVIRFIRGLTLPEDML